MRKFGGTGRCWYCAKGSGHGVCSHSTFEIIVSPCNCIGFQLTCSSTDLTPQKQFLSLEVKLTRHWVHPPVPPLEFPPAMEEAEPAAMLRHVVYGTLKQWEDMPDKSRHSYNQALRRRQISLDGLYLQGYQTKANWEARL